MTRLVETSMNAIFPESQCGIRLRREKQQNPTEPAGKTIPHQRHSVKAAASFRIGTSHDQSCYSRPPALRELRLRADADALPAARPRPAQGARRDQYRALD